MFISFVWQRGARLVTCFSTARPLIALPEPDPHSEPKGQFSLNITAEVLGRLLLLHQSSGVERRPIISGPFLRWPPNDDEIESFSPGHLVRVCGMFCVVAFSSDESTTNKRKQKLSSSLECLAPNFRMKLEAAASAGLPVQ
jgi:hypothetical protein